MVWLSSFPWTLCLPFCCLIFLWFLYCMLKCLNSYECGSSTSYCVMLHYDVCSSCSPCIVLIVFLLRSSYFMHFSSNYHVLFTFVFNLCIVNSCHTCTYSLMFPYIMLIFYCTSIFVAPNSILALSWIIFHPCPMWRKHCFFLWYFSSFASSFPFTYFGTQLQKFKYYPLSKCYYSSMSIVYIPCCVHWLCTHKKYS
jgi:hypothetical protein